MKLGLAELTVTELVGTTAVVLSLIFVGVGIRESNLEARAATVQSSLNSEMHLQEMLMLYAAEWDKVLSGEPLEAGEENRKAIILFNMLITESENRFYQVNSGYLDAQNWDGRVDTYVSLLQLPIYEQWKMSPGAKSHTAEFLGVLESLAERGGR